MRSVQGERNRQRPGVGELDSGVGPALSGGLILYCYGQREAGPQPLCWWAELSSRETQAP